MGKPTLLALAAGMGSRYGSLKQMDGVGPNGQTIIDYSVYDAVRAGFGKVVFVIRSSFAQEFRELFSESRFSGRIEVEYVFQELDSLPAGFTVPEGRMKPWGTNHAVMMGASVIDRPFAVINGDDFYGRESFELLGNYLGGNTSAGDYCMVGYRLQNTLSEHGTVSRGVCEVDEQGYLRKVTERTSIARDQTQIFYEENGLRVLLDPQTVVSMNMFGFTPCYFERSSERFIRFLNENATNPKAEFYIPSMVNELIETNQVRVKVLESGSQWFGVTYAEDKPIVQQKIAHLIAKGEYPEKLW